MFIDANEEMLTGIADAVANYHDTYPDASEFHYRLWLINEHEHYTFFSILVIRRGCFSSGDI